MWDCTFFFQKVKVKFFSYLLHENSFKFKYLKSVETYLKQLPVERHKGQQKSSPFMTLLEIFTTSCKDSQCGRSRIVTSKRYTQLKMLISHRHISRSDLADKSSQIFTTTTLCIGSRRRGADPPNCTQLVNICSGVGVTLVAARLTSPAASDEPAAVPFVRFNWKPAAVRSDFCPSASVRFTTSREGPRLPERARGVLA